MAVLTHCIAFLKSHLPCLGKSGPVVTMIKYAGLGAIKINYVSHISDFIKGFFIPNSNEILRKSSH